VTGSEARALVRQMLAIGALSVIVAAAFHFPLLKRFARGEFRETFFLREDFPGVRMIGLAEAEDLFAGAAAVFVDARQPFFFREGHVPGAMNVPYDSASAPLPGELLALPPEGTVVVYCEGGDCRSSLELAKALDGRGFRDLRVLSGGWDEWERAGLPVERGR
jgi:rhodanese-related sulfurtransferase